MRRDIGCRHAGMYTKSRRETEEARRLISIWQTRKRPCGLKKHRQEEKEEKTYTITEVRGFLGNLRKNGKKEAVTKLIEDMGYSKFSLVPEDKYPELMRRAEEL